MILRLFKKYQYQLLTLVIALICFTSYFRIPFLSFQQDELFTFGLFIKNGWPIIFRGFNSGNITHFVPIVLSLSYGIYSIFGTNYFIYNSIGLLIHLFNGLLLFNLTRKLFKDKRVGYLVTALFLSMDTYYELIMWPVISLNSISLTFGLIIWNLLATPLPGVKRKIFIKGILVALVFILSILSLEYAGGLFLFIPTATFFLNKDKFIKKLFFLTPFGLISLVYLIFRMSLIILSRGNSIIVDGGITIIKSTLSLISRYIGQIVMGNNLILKITNVVGHVKDISPTDYLYLGSHIYPDVSAVGGLIIIIIVAVLLIILYRNKNPRYSGILVSFSFVVYSSLPFMFIKNLTGTFPVIDSRYLYFGTLGVAIFVGYIFNYLFDLKHSRLKNICIVFLILIISSGVRGWVIKGNSYIENNKVRVKILSYINQTLTKIPDKVIFYSESDKSYYGLPETEKILPFQSGFGQTLLIILKEKLNLPLEFYPGEFLWSIDAQGYKEINSRGFGYFRKFDDLVAALDKYSLSTKNVISYKYNSFTGSIEENSENTRSKISGFYTPKTLMSNYGIKVRSDENIESEATVIDDNKDSCWQSTNPYSSHQSIIFEFSDAKTVSALEIYVGGDKDQNEVGYEVSYSTNGSDWYKLVDYLRCTPNSNNISQLYFRPTYLKYLKVKQSGEHKYAYWKICEIRFYQSLSESNYDK